MAKKSNLKIRYIEEKEKISRIYTLKGKLEYIWQYYSLWIIGISSIFLLLIYLAVHFATAIRENWFFITFTNVNQEIGNDSEFWKGYVEYTGFDTKLKNVEFNNLSFFDYAADHGMGNEYYELFVAHVDAGTLDAVTMEEESLVALGTSGRLMDLYDERCSSIREKYEKRFIYCTPNDEYGENPIPVGIDISDSILMTEYKIYPDSCVLGIGAQAGHIEAVEMFLSYIFEEEK